MHKFCSGVQELRGARETHAAVWSELMRWKLLRMLPLPLFSQERRGAKEKKGGMKMFPADTCRAYLTFIHQESPLWVNASREHPDRFGLNGTFCSELRILQER